MGNAWYEFTDQERSALNSLADAWNKFTLLPHESSHPDDTDEFKTAIHAAQRVILSRIARRTNPRVIP